MANNNPVIIAAQLARRFEGVYLRPYLCPAGIPTIGIGATFYEDGTRVTLRDPAITSQRAELLLVMMIRNIYLPAVMRLCPGIDCPYRIAALIDFAFNLGVNNLKNSTLRKRIIANDWASVPTELRKWVRGGGKVLPGLVRRRAAEIGLINGSL